MRAALLFFLAAAGSLAGFAEAATCPCSNPAWCKPIAAAGPRREVFGFTGASWQHYDWTQVTTVAWNSDPELMCFAHSKGARVVLQADFPEEAFANLTARQEWIRSHVQLALDNFMDGTNFDYESAVPLNSSIRGQLSDLVGQTTQAFHASIPGSQVSVDVAWGPYGVDGRFYDYVALANNSDLLFAMVYDTRSQIYGRCVASANSPLSLSQLGIQQFLDLGIPASKLVLGLPWYGYDYPCLKKTSISDPDCVIDAVPFRGAPCSDAAGKEYDFGYLYNVLSSGNWTTSGRMWDSVLLSPWFNVEHTDGSIHQIWYDDPESLSLRYQFAADMNLRGVGFWTMDALDYGATDPAVIQAMWDAVKIFSAAP